jgi:hypothetical protein
MQGKIVAMGKALPLKVFYQVIEIPFIRQLDEGH